MATCCTTFSSRGLHFPKPYTVTHLARSITRSQYHRKFIAFHKNWTSIKENNINSSAELFQEIQIIWIDITPQYVQSFYTSIPRRIMQVIRLKGHLTKDRVRLLQLFLCFVFVTFSSIVCHGMQCWQLSRKSYIAFVRPWRHFYEYFLHDSVMFLRQR